MDFNLLLDEWHYDFIILVDNDLKLEDYLLYNMTIYCWLFCQQIIAKTQVDRMRMYLIKAYERSWVLKTIKKMQSCILKIMFITY